MAIEALASLDLHFGVSDVLQLASHINASFASNTVRSGRAAVFN
jgi:hypothetical protein